MILPSEQDLLRESLSVATVARQLYPDWTIDTALPQPWVDSMTERGFDPRGTVVWGYPRSGSLYGQPLPLTVESMLQLIRQTA